MHWIKKLMLILLSLLAVCSTIAAHYWFTIKHRNNSTVRHSVSNGYTESAKFKKRIAGLPAYLRKHQYNDQFCFLADMEIASGKNRFFVYDLTRKKIMKAGLVTHGRCNESFLQGRRFDNAIGSGCTSLGHYRVGKPYYGRFGLAFKLHGTDSSNSNAFHRFVVLHAHSCVPANETDPYPLCQSDGCPTVAPSFLKELAPMINNSRKPVLLYIFP